MTTGTTTAPTIAVLGTGTIGAPIARNLRRAGFAVTAWNRTDSRAKGLADDDIRVAGTPAEAVADADIVLTVLKDAPAVLEVLDQAGDALAAGSVLIQVSTVGVDGIAQIADAATARSLKLVDAPIQGTKGPAENAQLVILASGAEDVRSTVDPIFDAIGKTTIWVSDAVGDASKLKLVVNTLISATTNGIAESLRFAEALGLDPQLFTRVVGGGPLESAFGAIKTGAILDKDFAPNFTIDNAVKDAELIAAAAADADVWLPVTAGALSRYRAAQEQGHGQYDFAATYLAERPE
ncbi:putative oxidoreductase [Gordonia soli NBRC 108243]|uniref:Putative oxidoreductase n=1 Tax=Gordonia soli NBRC 108243 TaxID=1223545 RepID=M0QHL9_9ACTN|nr:putative oxidoreductase [Gordonia soli NBRC 108243]